MSTFMRFKITFIFLLCICEFPCNNSLVTVIRCYQLTADRLEFLYDKGIIHNCILKDSSVIPYL